MTIDKEKLIELLVARTGLEKEKIEEQLLQLISRIKQAAGEGKSFQIEGLGTFNLGDDTLHFNPADTLETEINHKYAGMKPIELIGAFKETPPGGEDEKEQTEVKEHDAEPEEHTEEPVTTEREAEPEPELEPEPETESREEAADELETSLQNQLQEVFGGEEPTESQESADASEQSRELQEELSTVTGTEEPVEEEKSNKASFIFDEEEAKEEQETPPVDPNTPGVKKEKKDKDPIGTVLTVCVVVLAIGVAGWLVYDLGLLNALGSNNQADSQQEQAVQSASGRTGGFLADNSSDQPANEVSLENETGPSAPEQEPVNRVTGKDIGSQTDASDYGLMGKPTSRGNNGYTIVVHSLGNKNTSQTIKERLESEGYRAVLTSAVINGKIFWRVGLGQFRTVDDANEAVRMLPEQYENDHFIKRIQ